MTHVSGIYVYAYVLHYMISYNTVYNIIIMFQLNSLRTSFKFTEKKLLLDTNGLKTLYISENIKVYIFLLQHFKSKLNNNFLNFYPYFTITF